MSIEGIIAFDIDGTLTHRLDWIDPQVISMLKRLAANNWQIALFTGRSFSFASHIVKYLDFPYLSALQNGADFIQMPAKKQIARHYLSSDILPILEEAYEGQQEDFIIYAGMDRGDFCYFRPSRFSKKMGTYLEKLQSFATSPWQKSDFCFEEGSSFPQIKAFGEKSAMQALYQKLKDREEIEICFMRDPVDPSLYLNLISHPHANKGKTLEGLRRRIKPPIIIAAGDELNDLKMLREADIAIAIESAPEELKKEADILAKEPKHLGILEAVEEAIRRANS